MPIESNTKLGNIQISKEAIAALTGGIVSECYGVVGMASQKFLKDGLAELLKKENYGRGIVVKQVAGGIQLDLYIVVSYGVRISQVTTEIQSRVKYELERYLDEKLTAVNVFVQGIRVMS
ncbi:MAG: Asp23/Gls24 family envelope stress response protein [Erysipelotrichaceae bacterium]|jgi:uncharacterized alkaline shock family protein YloU|nr:Asp23/Gls24 family envelope stress response protein [Erysipelotrichaceae bacterium]